jgi:glyoxylase-like metal-dependent hydrolase (beta-lactamase superfamily II)
MTTTFRIGDITIHRIVEQEAPLFDPHAFFPDLTADQLAENKDWLEKAQALDPVTGKVNLCIQSYLVKTPQHTILVDSCVGNEKERPARPFWHRMKSKLWEQNLAAAGVGFNDIDFVMCTHLHVDHVGWNTVLRDGRWVPTFPKAQYIFSKQEYDYWAGENAKTPIPQIADSVIPIIEAKQAVLVADDHALNDLVHLEPTPGHTPNHVAVHMGKTGARAVMTGDLIHSPLQARYPEISMFSDYDRKQSAVTRRKFLESCCDTGTLMCMAHFPSPSAGKLTRWDNGYKLICDPA